ncbi:hypothetical protein EDB86DRAFT_1269313 [Lactarius hatsudake]|nr:hypothetical protein EDB86DRAFT_1269313 [Lactarius hatsudake]
MQYESTLFDLTHQDRTPHVYISASCLLFASFCTTPLLLHPSTFFFGLILACSSIDTSRSDTHIDDHALLNTDSYSDNSGVFLVVIGYFQTHQHSSGFRIHAVILVVMVFPKLLRKGTLSAIARGRSGFA